MFNLANIKIVGMESCTPVLSNTAEPVKTVDTKKKIGYKNAKPAQKDINLTREEGLHQLVVEVNKKKMKEDKEGNEYESDELEHSKLKCAELIREFVTDYYINEKKKLKV